MMCARGGMAEGRQPTNTGSRLGAPTVQRPNMFNVAGTRVQLSVIPSSSPSVGQCVTVGSQSGPVQAAAVLGNVQNSMVTPRSHPRPLQTVSWYSGVCLKRHVCE